MNLLKILRSKTFLTILVLVVLSIPSIFSLLKTGFFTTDDGEWMVIRFSAFHEALRAGQFPVRFLGRLNYGYGYPIANFLYPGFMYLAEPLKIASLGFVSSVKLVLIFSMIGSLIFTYLWLSRFFKRFESIIGSLFYLYTPYHLYDTYKRGSVGEILALAIVPFILWQIERKSFVLTSLGIAFLILSHNTLAFLFLPIVLLYIILRHSRSLISYLLSLILGFSLSSFFLIPALLELKYTNFSATKVSDFTQYFAGLSLIGTSTILVFLLSFFFLLLKKVKGANKKLMILFLSVGVISLLFSISISVPFWKILPASFIQFPFRLLSIVLLAVSFLVPVTLSVLSNKIKVGLAAIFLLILIISSFSFIFPSEFFNKGEGFYSTNEGTTTVQDEYMPKWVKQKPTEHFKEKVEVVSGESSISSLIYNSKKIDFNISSKTDSIVRINTIYYPGWKAFVNNQGSSMKYDNQRGLMELNIPKGESLINLSFSETPLRLFADILSFLSLLFLIFIKIKFPRFGI